MKKRTVKLELPEAFLDYAVERLERIRDKIKVWYQSEQFEERYLEDLKIDYPEIELEKEEKSSK